MERRKQELQELLKQQQFRPSNELTTFKIIKNVRELVTLATTSITSAKEEVLTCVPEIGLVVTSLFGVNEAAKQLINQGGTVRVITDISYSGIEVVKEVLDIGEEVRHFGQYRGIIFGVIDKKICFNAISTDITRLTLDQPVTWLWTDDAIYAKYLVSSFELLWKQAIPAAQRIEELLKEGAPQV